ncbi:putative pentatricopeptide repeat-containing protein At3g25970 [Cicer arietinum]|uniref:Pentatricopeptide repeat-containing protein At3g25970 n=1 Tax=Cicer arietinum TaxID=3827 RepID=A0A1S2YTW9_CICAR|nr:putative pentatricopeptide repeat-containing protein At3g25970 [Cicer arietinum]XP_012573912.1 putative pentatricopeptide repeat-containing protein At3g25970 [Cicer arietinum]XP_012573913.1 putative pentatricopeptide repeat-containing protein At3g25970 [Cicer arietinum]XP_012573914.1 putative pentatricopeptide repeat-containing protein At3g25970 [Cicer arietinum]XP_012573915.1 putative pentatricopeptide repeat-containing protein At3g25970 [Cicer arietinum]XP_027192847.1 putative pentatricop
MHRLHSLIRTSPIALPFLKATHCLAIKSGFISDPYTSNNLITAYVKCNELNLAHQLFDEMPQPDTVSWNVVISGYVNSGDLDSTWQLLNAMRISGHVFNSRTFASVLKGVARACRIELGQQLHSVMIKTRFTENVFSGSALVDLYSKCGRVGDALVVFLYMPECNCVSWNTLIAGYSRVGDVDMVFWLLRCQELEGVGIDDGTMAPLLTLLVRVEFYSLVMQLHCKIMKHGLEAFDTVCGAVIKAYSHCSSLLDAERVFDGCVASRDLVTWNSMLAAYLLHKKEDTVFEVFIDMQSFGFEPDDYSYTGVISSCSVKEHKSRGESLHGLVIKRGLEVSVPVSDALIAMYLGFDNRYMEDALRIFFSMDVKDCCTWNTVLSGYVQVGWSEDALKLFVHVRSLFVEIDDYTFSAVIRCCSDLATLQLGQQVHVLALKVGFDNNKYVGSSLIFMYSKCGVIEDARKYFEATSNYNAIVWNSIIFAYAQHGQGNIALEFFYLMRERKVKPDHITFVAVLTACSHKGLLEEGRKIIQIMESDFGIPLQMKHYACAVDLYGRAGHLEEAKALIETMPFEPDAMVLTTLLGACRSCGDIELASHVAKTLLELEPEDHSTYVLLSSLYGRLKMWDEKASVIRLMRERGVKKVPGWSWIEVKNKVHAFNAEDHSHPQSEEIYVLLQHLKEGIKLFDSFVGQT